MTDINRPTSLKSHLKLVPSKPNPIEEELLQAIMQGGIDNNYAKVDKLIDALRQSKEQAAENRSKFKVVLYEPKDR